MKTNEKTFTKFLLIGLTLGLMNTATAQQVNEAFIRNLDNSEVNAVLKADTTALFTKLWSQGMVINTPQNLVGSCERLKGLARIGKLEYSSFERTIEKITVFENVGIVMGQEIVKPTGRADNVGKTITRRFTNVWMKEKPGWRMVARQATVISML